MDIGGVIGGVLVVVIGGGVIGGVVVIGVVVIGVVVIGVGVVVVVVVVGLGLELRKIHKDV